MNKKISVLIMVTLMSCMLLSCKKNIETETTAISTIYETTGAIVETTLPEGHERDTDVENTTLTTPISTEPEENESTVHKSTEPKVTEPKHTEPKATEPVATEPKATEPVVTEPKATEPVETEPKPTEPTLTEPPVSDGPCCEYDKYMAMSPADQEAYMRTFSDPMAFIQWSQKAEAEHKAHDDTINVEGGDLNIGNFIK